MQRTSRRRTGVVVAIAATVAALTVVPAGAYGTDPEAPHDHPTGPGAESSPPDGGPRTSGVDHIAALTGGAEVPSPGDPDGAGLAMLVLDAGNGRACLHLTYGDIAAPTAAHIHEGPAGVAGPIVVNFTSTLGGDDCVDADSELLARIEANPAGFYVNVHNARFPAGAIRGQLVPTDGLADEVVIPAGFQPEGIAVDPHDGTFYVGSLAGGAVYRGDLTSGEGAVLVEPVQGAVAVGVHLDGGQLWVAGGPTGQARVYDAGTGELLDSWQLASGNTFINDVVVAGGTAWFTDSLNPVLYGVRPGDDRVTSLPLSGDLQFVEGFNTNGIEATPDGATLVVVQSATGSLFRVDPATGSTGRIDLGGETVANGDGLLFDGGYLYVVQNRLNQIARIELSADLASGTVLARLTDPDLNVPTTVGAFAGHLWAVNARFGTTPTPDTFYSVVQVRG